MCAHLRSSRSLKPNRLCWNVKLAAVCPFAESENFQPPASLGVAAGDKWAGEDEEEDAPVSTAPAVCQGLLATLPVGMPAVVVFLFFLLTNL